MLVMAGAFVFFLMVLDVTGVAYVVLENSQYSYGYPDNPDLEYCVASASDSGRGKRALKTSNGRWWWRPIRDGEYDWLVLTKSDELYIGGDTDGNWMSADGGRTWTEATSLPPEVETKSKGLIR